MTDAARVAALQQAARQSRVELSSTAEAKLSTYIDTLLHWRTRVSLTTAASAGEIIAQHISDSLAIVPHLPRDCCIADIGSGAGFPGVVIGLARPDLHVVLIESRRKRASFLHEVVRQTAMKNAEVLEARVEELPPSFTGKFDVVTARAFGPLSEFLALSAPWLRVGGAAIAMKGPKGRDEARVYAGFGEPEIATYSLGSFGERLLIKYTRV